MTDLIAKYQRVESIVAHCETGKRPVVMWVTAREWAEFAEEVSKLEFVKPDGDKRAPIPENFQWVLIGKNLKVANAGTDDQRFVDSMNWQEAPLDFQQKRDALRIG